jgi:hypothetical protein
LKLALLDFPIKVIFNSGCLCQLELLQLDFKLFPGGAVFSRLSLPIGDIGLLGSFNKASLTFTAAKMASIKQLHPPLHLLIRSPYCSCGSKTPACDAHQGQKNLGL